MSLLAGWFFEGAMLRHTPSLTDLAVWEIASGGSSKSPATREQPDGLQMTRRRTLAVAVNGRNMILRGDLDRLPGQGESVRMLGLLYARPDSAAAEFGGTRCYEIRRDGDSYRATPT